MPEVRSYLVKLTHTGTTSQSLRTLSHSSLNFYMGIWIGAGFGVELINLEDYDGEF